MDQRLVDLHRAFAFGFAPNILDDDGITCAGKGIKAECLR
jgi:hypothetical protein